MGGVCSSKPAETPNAFDPKDYVSLEIHEDEMARSSEQRNLLRFKVEVLINMLAIEEKKMGALTKRIEVLKWSMLSKGVSEDGLNDILKSIPGTMVLANGANDKPIISNLPSTFDLGGAIERLQGEFMTNKKDIVQSFADDEGKIVTSLSKDEFMRQLFAATEAISKSDIHAIALRFYDGTSVSIVEFIEFFLTPNAVRQAKSAAAAVRMSLDLLQLDQNNEYWNDPNINDEEEQMQLMVTSSHQTASLDRGTKILQLIWFDVEYEIENLFNEAEDLDEQIILAQTFKKILSSTCGTKSKLVKKAQARSPNLEIIGMTNDDIDMLTERFEIGGRVHYGHFLQYYREVTAPPLSINRGKGRARTYTAVDGSLQVASTKPKMTIGISPFRMSSEWAALKSDATKNYNSERESCKKEIKMEENKLMLLKNENDKYDNKSNNNVDRDRLKQIGIEKGKENEKLVTNNNKLLLLSSDQKKLEDSKTTTTTTKAESKNTKVILDLDNKDNNNNKDDNNDNNEIKFSSNSTPSKNIRSHLGQYENAIAEFKSEEKKDNDKNEQKNNNKTEENKNTEMKNSENKDVLDIKKLYNNALNKDDINPNLSSELDSSPVKRSMFNFGASSKKMAPLPPNKTIKNNTPSNNNNNNINNNNDNNNNNNNNSNSNKNITNNKTDIVNPSRLSWFSRGKSIGKEIEKVKEKEVESKNNYDNYTNKSDDKENNRNYYNSDNDNDNNRNESKNNDNNNNNNNNNKNYNTNRMILDTGSKGSDDRNQNDIITLKQPQPSQSPSNPKKSRFLSWGKKDENINILNDNPSDKINSNNNSNYDNYDNRNSQSVAI